MLLVGEIVAARGRILIVARDHLYYHSDAVFPAQAIGVQWATES
jgi:hypothetical protein